jgi:hypothetical protein
MLMEKDKEKYKGHSAVMKILQMFLKLEVSLLKCDRYMGEKCQDHTYTI